MPIEDESEDEPRGRRHVRRRRRARWSKEAIEAGLAPHSAALTDCYTTKVGKRRWLGGHVVLHWDIKADGAVTAVKLAESDLGAWAVEKCLLDIAWHGDVRQADRRRRRLHGAARLLGDERHARSGTKTRRCARSAASSRARRLRGLRAGQAGEAGKKAKKAPKPPKAEAEKPARPEQPPSNVTITLYVGPRRQGAVGRLRVGDVRGRRAWAACAEQAATAWRLPIRAARSRSSRFATRPT